MKQTVFCTFFLCAMMTTLAQEGNFPLDRYADFKKRTLIVVRETPNQKLVDELTPEQLEMYKTEIDEYNTLIKWAMDTWYKTGNPVEYKTPDEVDEIVKRKDNGFAILSYTKFRQNYKTKLGFELTQKNRFAKGQSKAEGVFAELAMASIIEIQFAEADFTALSIYRQYLPSPFPDKADMAYAIRQLVNVFNDREKGITTDEMEKQVKKELKSMQAKKLLVCEMDIDPKEDRAKFISAYKFQAEITSKEKIEQAITNHDSNSACVIVVPMLESGNVTDKVVFKFFLFDCSSGRTMSYSVPQDKVGFSVSNAAMNKLSKLKETFVDSRIPGLRKENMMDFKNAIR